MFSHVLLGADDVDVSKKFYDAILCVLGLEPGLIEENGRCFYISDLGILAVAKPFNEEPAQGGNGVVVGFKASSPQKVDEWYATGLENGGSDYKGPPAERIVPAGKFYAGYLLDPYGNKVCAVYDLI